MFGKEKALYNQILLLLLLFIHECKLFVQGAIV